MPLLLDPTRRGFVTGAASAGIFMGLSCSAPAETASGAVAGLADRIVKDKRAPGVIIGRGKGSAPPDYVARGTTAFGNRRAVDQDTLWRIYSMTKPITGMAAMILIAENKLKLDQPVADFIPAFANISVSNDGTGLQSHPAKTMITVRHLLTHTSGLIYGEFTSSPISDAYLKLGIHPIQTTHADKNPMAPNLAEFAERVATLPLVCEPGTNWVYGVGLDVLGRVIEVASGEAFDQFLQNRIFDPLGMASTFFTVPQSQEHRLATSYERKRFSVDVLDPTKSSIYLRQPPFPFGGSGLVSSARDYDRFLAMIGNKGSLEGKQVMSPDAVALGVSNLAPEGANLSVLRDGGNQYEFPAAGGGVSLGGPMDGAFGWSGLAGTSAKVNVKTGSRWAGFINVVSETILMEQLAPAVLKDFG